MKEPKVETIPNPSIRRVFKQRYGFPDQLLKKLQPIHSKTRKSLHKCIRTKTQQNTKVHAKVHSMWPMHSSLRFFLSITCILFASMLWYIMLNFVVKYYMRCWGNDFENLGVVTLQKENQIISQSKQEHYLENTNRHLEEFSSNFSYLFLLQIVTSSICICGGVYSLAFSSHTNLVQDGFYFIVLFYCFFDTFTLLYLGNEIMLASDRLSYLLFESDWMEQTQSCKKCILIVVERLKQPQLLIVVVTYIIIGIA